MAGILYEESMEILYEFALRCKRPSNGPRTMISYTWPRSMIGAHIASLCYPP
jgi:hypothetical protein